MKTYVFMNKKNNHKFITVIRYKDRHYYMKPFMRFENGVVNTIGSGRLVRVSKRTLSQILEDYEVWI